MKEFKVGLQLYSVRDNMESDVDNTLKQVSEAGYDYVEFAGFFGYSAQAIKEMLDKYNLKCVSVHQGFEDFTEKNIEGVNYLKYLGVKYVCIPWMDMNKHIGGLEFKSTIDKITAAAEFLKENGMQLLYHNHEFEFNLYKDEFIMTWLLNSVPGSLLKSQVDTCWVNFAGYDPAEYLNGLENQAPIIHIKDYVCKNNQTSTVSPDNIELRKTNKIKSHDECGFEFRPLGQGVVDIPKILEAAKKAGTEYIIVEHDAVQEGMTQMEMSMKGRRYLKELGI